MTHALDEFFRAWTMTAADGRDEIIASAWGGQVYYVDPRTDAPITDMPGLCSYVGEFLPNCPPGARVAVADPVDVNNGHARATVHFEMSQDMRQTGQYFADLDAQGRITRLVGYVGKGAN